jgi:hypothetical protein
MKPFVFSLILAAAALESVAFAQDAACEVKALDKKLAGAAKASFVKKCIKDTAEASCQNQAFMKKLAGAAKASFLKKCVADAK